MYKMFAKKLKLAADADTATEIVHGILPTAKPKRNKGMIRDLMLVKEIQQLNTELPSTCEISFDDPDKLFEIKLIVKPIEGYWAGGSFVFEIVVGEEYNFAPPKAKCTTKLWHPNINEDGKICLSLLRKCALDGLGWAPTRTIKDVIWGLNSLFTDLLNFEDPLNMDAAEEFGKDPEKFKSKVGQYIKQYCV